MGTFLFDSVIFGPVYSRRLGQSLGLNLLNADSKICSFNCVYCECGWTGNRGAQFVSLQEYTEALEMKLKQMNENNEHADSLTFAGNGEPTLHPQFDSVVDTTLKLRDKYLKDAAVAVLSNSSTLNNTQVIRALLNVDLPIMKLDAGSEEMFRRVNQPNSNIRLEEIVSMLQKFNGKLIIQTLLLKGEIEGKELNNTTEEELKKIGEHLQKIDPRTLMLYSIARGTPLDSLQKVSIEELNKAAGILKKYIPSCDIHIY